ncbi:asparagine synthase (glutamine-hydrolyzing) [Algoriphagus sp. AGSA1]|uniref:asparagine synthase (glutamine-hydrolyzing) n=1 Tax=Algoriphagus sp. AGSA1 TaxID=2907213 RepID=UPI001F41B021|nr:asparagine synthase (glutamine-hydrolyzing) [Algoriphagus sp. AGSA1]MCE7055899.1 asparagine synthase (glutamine-hydrolyzing) [Algoriphagus sp. AGSA1]
MCGIHLIWGKGANEHAINEMLEKSQHRGPDHRASCSPWPGLWIGVSRLRIIDTKPESDQPFWSSDTSSLLVWNGELYNHPELRQLLIAIGIAFSTQSDTEVVLHLLRIFGPPGLEKMQGMFTLIYADLADKSLLIARDKNGEKPLYFAQGNETLLISSECRSIQSFKKSDFNPKQLEPYFYLRTPIPGKTFFKKVHELKPGDFSKLYNPISLQWKTIPHQRNLPEKPSYQTFKKTLQNAVIRQFCADVPVGMLLSGGADSSLLYAFWYKETGKALPSYTVQVAQKYRKRYADGDAAERFSLQFPTRNHKIEVNQKIFWENWDDYVKSIDQPIGDSAGFLNWLIGKEAKKSVKVLISGAGADELWGGYQRHKAFAFYQKNKAILLRSKGFLDKIPLERSYHKFIAGIVPNPHRTFLNFSALENIPDSLADKYTQIFNRNLSEYRQILDFDRRVYLVQDVLKVQDNALMAHSIEGRSPYLDETMQVLWRNINDEGLLRGKPWIKSYLTELGLGWISKRPKMGFGLPLQEWFAENSGFAARIFSSLRAFEKTHGEWFPSEMRSMCASPQTAVKNHFLTLYNLFLLSEWVKLHKL